jgi:hypothetical protein
MRRAVNSFLELSLTKEGTFENDDEIYSYFYNNPSANLCAGGTKSEKKDKAVPLRSIFNWLT